MNNGYPASVHPLHSFFSLSSSIITTLSHSQLCHLVGTWVASFWELVVILEAMDLEVKLWSRLADVERLIGKDCSPGVQWHRQMIRSRQWVRLASDAHASWSCRSWYCCRWWRWWNSHSLTLGAHSKGGRWVHVHVELWRKFQCSELIHLLLQSPVFLCQIFTATFQVLTVNFSLLQLCPAASQRVNQYSEMMAEEFKS